MPSESRPESNSSDVSLILSRVLENTSPVDLLRNPENASPNLLRFIESASPNLLRYLESASPGSLRLTPSPSVSRPASASSALTISAKHPASSPPLSSRPDSTSSIRSSPTPELQRGSQPVDING